MRTPTPELRITRWLRRYERQPIPFEAECTACADAQFKIEYDKRQIYRDPSEMPQSTDYMKKLQMLFEEHLRLVHPTNRVRPGQ